MVVVDGVDLDDYYVVKITPYNGTGPTGGDSLTENLNIWYEVRGNRRTSRRRNLSEYSH